MFLWATLWPSDGVIPKKKIPSFYHGGKQPKNPPSSSAVSKYNI